eukprot:TRINITY_DN9256_c0_g1_i2.p1 TRINITY_DN9256_c0_g1~~TRINITY_DN9256_c0_g1_i2.p1  ORF type:complete len:299 (-),score=42.95 TRINITY_DN9256_c0_g1_i2:6-902(-)
MSAYMFFANTHRPTVMKHYPDITCPDVTRILGKMWSETTDGEKKLFEHLAEKDKERYQNEKKIYASLPKREEYPKKPRKKRAKKDPSAPKRNMSAYLFFSNIRRHDVKKARPELTFSEIAKVLSKMWKVMSSRDKRPFEDMARNDKLRYFKEKKEFDEIRAKQDSQVNLPQQRGSLQTQRHSTHQHIQTNSIPILMATVPMTPMIDVAITPEQLEQYSRSPMSLQPPSMQLSDSEKHEITHLSSLSGIEEQMERGNSLTNMNQHRSPQIRVLSIESNYQTQDILREGPSTPDELTTYK